MEEGDLHPYLAGLLDGDGYLKITPQWKKAGTFVPYFVLTAGAAQLWPSPAISLFAETFGVGVKLLTRPGFRPMARWEIHNHEAAAAVECLLPYLLIKKQQAQLFLELAALREHARPLPTSIRKRMEEIGLALLCLHEGVAIDPGHYDWRSFPNAVKEWEFQRPRNEILAYLAGIMDSDGCFKIRRATIKRMINPHYRIIMTAAQVLPGEAIHLLAKTFGGNVTLKRPKRPGQRALASWTLCDGQAVGAVENILTCLLVKKQEASLLLELRELKSRPKLGLTYPIHPTRWGHSQVMPKRCYSPDQVASMEALRLQLIALHRGVPVESLAPILVNSVAAVVTPPAEPSAPPPVPSGGP